MYAGEALAIQMLLLGGVVGFAIGAGLILVMWPYERSKKWSD